MHDFFAKPNNSVIPLNIHQGGVAPPTMHLWIYLLLYTAVISSFSICRFRAVGSSSSISLKG